MQRKDEKTLHLTRHLGQVIKKLRKEKTGLSISKLSNSYGLDHGNVSRIENGHIDSKFTTIWRVAEALGMRTSELINVLETELGADFHLIDE